MTRNTFKSLIALFYLVTIGLVITGLVFGFYYPDYDSEYDLGSKFNHTVGGDAYNYIIMGARGLIFIGLAGITSVIGVAVNISYIVIWKEQLISENKADNKQLSTNSN